MVYFQVIWSGLREPMRPALEALVMERQIEGRNGPMSAAIQSRHRPRDRPLVTMSHDAALQPSNRTRVLPEGRSTGR
jgi:hypothetical protein